MRATPVMTAAERAALIEAAPPAVAGAATAVEAEAREGGIRTDPLLLAPVVTLSAADRR